MGKNHRNERHFSFIFFHFPCLLIYSIKKMNKVMKKVEKKYAYVYYFDNLKNKQSDEIF